jgi:hypothetical protein
MPSWPYSIPPILTEPSEAVRRHLYDLVRVLSFYCPNLDSAERDPNPYTAEDANLSIINQWGRWFAVWERLEVDPERPERERTEVLKITEDYENGLGIMLHEV